MRTAMIIGGGIGGLALGGLLRISGDWRVQIYERAAALPETGTTLAMWPEAMAVLDRLDIGNRIRQLGIRHHRARICRSDGLLIASVDSGADVWLIDRPELLAALAERAGGVTFNSTATDWRAVGTGADLIVGADGVHSPTRAAFTSDKPIRPGVTIWRGAASLASTELVETWGPGAIFGATPRPGGQSNWYATLDRPPSESPAALPGLFATWHPGVRAVLASIEASSVLRHEMLIAPALRRYTRGRIALIGDAAHAMAPNIGRGACEALIDAASLADQLAARSVPDALAGYDRARRRPTRNLVWTSRLLGRLSMARRFLGVRDLSMRAAARLA